MKKTFILFAFLLLITPVFHAQNQVEEINQKQEKIIETLDLLKRFKVSGYIQTQYQYGEPFSSLKVGGKNSDFDRDFNRFGIRRGRVKLTYDKGLVSGVFQLDIIEKGVNIKDAYLTITDPWTGSNTLKAGVFNRPFGHEISYSSSRRESPERALVNTTLFPEERDLGVQLSLQTPKNTALHFLKLDAAMVSGNGIKIDTDNYKDFIGRLSAKHSLPRNIEISGGASYYYGSVYQGSEKVYKMDGKTFVAHDDPSNFQAYAKREYFGFDVQSSIQTTIGKTQLRAEYLFGTQPGAQNSSKSPNYSVLPTHDTYIREFNGYYINLVQDLGKSNLSVVLKYDAYNPNTKVTKNEIGRNGTGVGDLAYTTLGSGLIWHINNELRLTAYYDWITNETSTQLAGYEQDIADNTFTLRLQYKF